MSNNKETQEPLMGQPVELEVVGATEATQAAGEASVRPQREEPLKGRKAARKPAGKEGEAAGEAVEAQGAAREEAATPSGRPSRSRRARTRIPTPPTTRSDRSSAERCCRRA